MSDYLQDLLLNTIRPVHDGLQAEFGVPASIEADMLSLAIKVQESGTGPVRDQGDPNVTGPATGLWQFEKTGGVWEVLNSAKIAPVFLDLCARAGVRAEADAVWRFFTTVQGDELAAAGARLVMYLDPAPLPPATPGGAQAALAYYLRRWRPAKNPKREQDFVNVAWPTALAIIEENPRAGAGSVAQPVSPSAGVPVASAGDAASLSARVAALEAKLERVSAVLR